MTIALENYLRKSTDLNHDEIKRIAQQATFRKLRRNEFLFREGELCRYKAFIAVGMVRTFGITPDGNEHILQFSPEDSWALDAESYDRNEPSRYNISAVEPSELLLWTKFEFNTLLAEIPNLKSFAERLIASNIYSTRQRLLTSLSATPEQKYDDFVQKSPDLQSRLPLWMIAAYLGVSLKTLTRLRHAQLQR